MFISRSRVLRRLLRVAPICAAFLFAAPLAHAQIEDVRWEVLAPDERQIVDLLAADFYEDSLRLAQSRAIEAHTAEIYVEANAEDRARFRSARLAAWRALTSGQRKALRDAERPVYANLTDEQKAPFRKIALDKLDAAGAIDNKALALALRREI